MPAASSNFLQFNPALVNCESDASYAVDALRTGGIPNSTILPSATGNKLFYQASTFIAAFCQMMVNKGFSPLDSDFANLVAVLTNVKTTADFASAIVTVPYASSILFNAAAATEFDLTLTGNVAASNITGQIAGQLLLFIITQDATGGRTFSWPVSLTSPGAICSLANSTSVQMFVVRPSGPMVPVTPMAWITPTGLITQLPGIASVSTSGSVSSAYSELVEKVDASGGAITRTLYSAIGRSGFKVNMKKMDSSTNVVTAAAYSGQTIDTYTTFPIIRQFDSLTFVSDGANWVII